MGVQVRYTVCPCPDYVLSGLCPVWVVSVWVMSVSVLCLCPGYVRVWVMSVSGLCPVRVVSVRVMSCLGFVCLGYVLTGLCLSRLCPSTSLGWGLKIINLDLI